jgi:hypothetical protein
MFNNSVLTARKTQRFTITKISWLMLFKEINCVYTENHKIPYKQNAELLIAKAAGAYRYHYALKG